jgi:peroxiredoxin/outer membrane lipoprotein-sorting protein
MKQRLWAGSWLAVLATAAAAQETEAWKILERTASTYAEARDYASEGSLTFSFSMVFGEEKGVMRQQVAFQRPNKLFLHSNIGMGRPGWQTVISDGRQVYTRIDVLNQYTRKPAPATLQEIQALGADGPAEFGAMLSVPALLDGVDLKTRVTEASLDRSGTYFGVPVYILSLTLEGGHTEQLWIGREDGLIRRLTFRANMENMIAEMRRNAEESLKQMLEGQDKPEGEDEPPAEGDAEGDAAEAATPQISEEFARTMMEQMLEAFSEMEMTVTERYKEVRINAGVPQELFRFRRLPLERLVAELDELPEEEEPEEAPAPAGPETPEVNLTGQQAPDFTLNDLEGNAVTLSALRGKPVLLDFWASWCGPCRMELPQVQELYQEYAEKGLQVVAVSVDAAVEDARKAAEEDKLTFPVLWGDSGAPEMQQVNTAYGISSIPRLLLIDANGVVQADVVGYHEKAQLVEMLAKVGL